MDEFLFPTTKSKLSRLVAIKRARVKRWGESEAMGRERMDG